MIRKWNLDHEMDNLSGRSGWCDAGQMSRSEREREGNSKVSEKSGVKKGRVGDMRNSQASKPHFLPRCRKRNST